MGLSVSLVSVGAYVTARVQMSNALDESLLERARFAAESDTLAQLTAISRIPSYQLGAADVRVAFLSENAAPVTYDDGPPIQIGEPELAVLEGGSDSSIRTIRAGSIDYRVATVPAGDTHALVVAQALTSQQLVLQRLGQVTLLFAVAGVLAAAVAGFAVAHNGLRPVRRLTSRVEDIARTENLEPLPVEGHDEIARLATAFNAMLVALAASRDRQRRLVADAGHELRTPLTSLRTNLDLLDQSRATDGPDLPPEAHAELMDDVRAQIEELSTLVGDLVELARDEPGVQQVAPVDLAEVVDQALGRVRRRAPGLAWDVRLDPWTVQGESSTLERAVTNLLDNAAKWSPPGGTVHVTLTSGRLAVEDEGPGIPEQDVPHVFERFYRASESRTMPGSGLGLAIVHQAALRHQGSVAAGRSAYGGARLVLDLPGVPG